MGEDIVITYETLFDILRREKNKEDLQELDPDFLQQVNTYLKEKQEMMQGQNFADRQENLRIQIANTRKIIKELYDRRERKVVNLALYQSRAQGSLLSTKAFLPFERTFLMHF